MTLNENKIIPTTRQICSENTPYSTLLFLHLEMKWTQFLQTVHFHTEIRFSDVNENVIILDRANCYSVPNGLITKRFEVFQTAEL